jgi:transglutaminase-like putative cysteine protease
MADTIFDLNQGMRLRVTHSTHFTYEDEVLESHNEARLCPISDPLQRCVSFQLKVEPAVQLITRRDFFLNRVDYFDVMSPHGSLDVKSEAEVETRPEMRGEVPQGMGLEALDSLDTDVSVFDFQVASELIATPVQVAEEAKRQAQTQIMREQEVRTEEPAPYEPTPINEPATLKLGDINESFGFTVTADFLESLGVKAAEKKGRAVLYRPSDFDRICYAIINHIKNQLRRQAA